MVHQGSGLIILFLQYLNQRKKIDAEEKRFKQRKARDDFLMMLEVR
jgi:pre-mRNA-processing factor 40